MAKKKDEAVCTPATEPNVMLPSKIMGLDARMLCIMANVGSVEKKGWNSIHKYAFVRESDIIEQIRGLLVKYCVMITSSVESVTVNQRGEKSAITQVMMRVRFTNIDDGTYTESCWPGHGLDSGDKGVYKAMTGAMKYALLKTFMISTNDDPEEDEEKPKEKEQKQKVQETSIEDDPTVKARKIYFAMFNKLLKSDGITWRGELVLGEMNDNDRHAYIGDVLKRDVKSMSGMTLDEYRVAYKILKSGIDPAPGMEDESGD